MLWVRVGQENEVTIMRWLHGLFVLLAAAVCCGNDCVEVGVVDEGFHVADDGVELRPMLQPVSVAADDTVEDETLLPEAVAWCNEQASQDGVLRVPIVVAEPGETPRVMISIGYVPAPDWGESFEDFVVGGESEPAGIAYLDYDLETGEILGAEVVLSSDIAYDRPTLLKVLEHETLHAVWGLDDDPGIDVTVELRSIMSSPLDPLGRLTQHDFLLVLPYLP